MQLTFLLVLVAAVSFPSVAVLLKDLSDACMYLLGLLAIYAVLLLGYHSGTAPEKAVEAFAARCFDAGTPLISAMGAGNKLFPERFEVADIFDTSVCPLARAMRAQLRKRGVKKLKVVYSKEEPITPQGVEERVPGSTAFTPSVAGLILAGAVLRDLAGINR